MWWERGCLDYCRAFRGGWWVLPAPAHTLCRRWRPTFMVSARGLAFRLYRLGRRWQAAGGIFASTRPCTHFHCETCPGRAGWCWYPGQLSVVIPTQTPSGAARGLCRQGAANAGKEGVAKGAGVLFQRGNGAGWGAESAWGVMLTGFGGECYGSMSIQELGVTAVDSGSSACHGIGLAFLVS